MKFMGEGVDLKDAKVVILPVPYEGTTTYLAGTHRGPSAILKGSLELENPEEWERTPPLFHTLPPVRFPSLLPSDAIRNIADITEKLYSENKKIILLGGEHTITLGGVLPLNEEEVSVLSIDAHLDFYREYNGETLSHATVLYRVAEKFDIAHVGARIFCSEEYRLAQETCSILFPGRTIFKENIEEILHRILKKKVYLSIDIDILDISQGIGVGNPAPSPGWTMEELKVFVSYVLTTFEVKGVDIVEFRPSGRGDEVEVAGLVKHIIDLLLLT